MGHLIIKVWFGDTSTFIETLGYLNFLFQISVSDQDGSSLPLHRRGAEVGDSSRSPDLSCLDYWFWGVAMAELKATMENFAKILEEEEVTKAARGIMKCARGCRAVRLVLSSTSGTKILKSLEEMEE